MTPASLSGYTVFKIVYGFAISVLSNLILLGGLKLIAGNQYVIGSGEGALRLLDNLSWGKVLIFSLASSLFVPAVAFFLGTHAKTRSKDSHF